LLGLTPNPRINPGRDPGIGAFQSRNDGEIPGLENGPRIGNPTQDTSDVHENCETLRVSTGDFGPTEKG